MSIGIEDLEPVEQLAVPFQILLLKIQESVSGVVSFSVEGVQTVDMIETLYETVDSDKFMEILEFSILPLMNRYPSVRSVLVLDNCRVHNKYAIFALA